MIISLADLLSIPENRFAIDRLMKMAGHRRVIGEYASRPTPFPAIKLSMNRHIRGGNHRAAAAEFRGDLEIDCVIEE